MVGYNCNETRGQRSNTMEQETLPLFPGTGVWCHRYWTSWCTVGWASCHWCQGTGSYQPGWTYSSPSVHCHLSESESKFRVIVFELKRFHSREFLGQKDKSFCHESREVIQTIRSPSTIHMNGLEQIKHFCVWMPNTCTTDIRNQYQSKTKSCPTIECPEKVPKHTLNEWPSLVTWTLCLFFPTATLRFHSSTSPFVSWRRSCVENSLCRWSASA